MEAVCCSCKDCSVAPVIWGLMIQSKAVARFSTLLAVHSNTTGTVYAPESHAPLNTSEGLFARKSLNL